MFRDLAWLVLAFAIVAPALTTEQPAAAADDKGVVVELDGLKSRAPAEWKEEAPSNQMRLAQFSLPKVKDDKQDAEIVIFKGIGGSTKDNVERWKKMFIPPEGKNLDDVAKIKESKVAGAAVTYLDVQGTYKYKARPFDPNAKEELRPNFRMLGVVFEKDNPYHIRLVGPAKTVEHYQKGFDNWINSFK